MCLDKGRTTAGKYVDHITPIRQGGDKFDYSNLQTLCTSCHASKSSKDGKKSK
jgi:5-methylcytosine-specific restriction protein A